MAARIDKIVISKLAATDPCPLSHTCHIPDFMRMPVLLQTSKRESPTEPTTLSSPTPPHTLTPPFGCADLGLSTFFTFHIVPGSWLDASYQLPASSIPTFNIKGRS